jgi:hypothetical protein
MGERGITFGRKDYRAKLRARHKTMTLEAHGFMRRFVLHVVACPALRAGMLQALTIADAYCLVLFLKDTGIVVN